MATNMNVSIRYSTFLPVLMEAMNRTNGDVLELGPGVFSTPFLHWMCRKMKRRIVTIENDEKWYYFCRKYYQYGSRDPIYHKFIHVKDWDDADSAIKKEWDVVLVDHSPSERRVIEIRKLANLAKYIIVHDADDNKEKNYHLSTIYPLFKYRYDFKHAEPATVVLSNFVDLKDFYILDEEKPNPDSGRELSKSRSGTQKMKNLLIYVNPEKKFSKEHDDLTKIQIDNSLALGWKAEDIMLVTNFPYEYKGVKAITVDDYEVFDQNRSTKIPAIIQLFKEGLIGDSLYWFHDHDAFQLEPFEMNYSLRESSSANHSSQQQTARYSGSRIKLEKDAGFTDYRQGTWNAGSFFFKKSAEDIFLKIWELMNQRNTNEQDALTYMWQNNTDRISDRYELMNITYNLGLDNLKNKLSEAQLPIKVAHFHPHKQRHLDLFRSILPERLLSIFNKYGIQ